MNKNVIVQNCIFLLAILCLFSCNNSTPSPSNPVATSEYSNDLSNNALVSNDSEITVPKNLETLVIDQQETIISNNLKTPVSHQPKKSFKKDNIPTIIRGKIPSNITKNLQLEKGKYTIEKRIVIQKSGKLHIPAGTELEFEEGGILCLGIVTAIGTEKEPILFTGINGWDGITISGEKSQGIFHYCKISSATGIYVNKEKKGKYQLNQGSYVAGGAFLYVNDSSGKLENCEISDISSQNAIEILTPEMVEIVGCTISENVGNGIFCEDAHIHISSNHISHHNNGISITGETTGKIEKNVIEKNNEVGISIQNLSILEFIQNDISQNMIGIDMTGSSNGVFRENILRKNKIAGIVCQNDSVITAVSNEISENLIAGVALKHRVVGKIEKNKFSYNNVAIVMLHDASMDFFDNSIFQSMYVVYREETTNINKKDEKSFKENNQINNCKVEEIIGTPIFITK